MGPLRRTTKELYAMNLVSFSIQRTKSLVIHTWSYRINQPLSYTALNHESQHSAFIRNLAFLWHWNLLLYHYTENSSPLKWSGSLEEIYWTINFGVSIDSQQWSEVWVTFMDADVSLSDSLHKCNTQFCQQDKTWHFCRRSSKMID